jgi:hypothetical protein
MDHSQQNLCTANRKHGRSTDTTECQGVKTQLLSINMHSLQNTCQFLAVEFFKKAKSKSLAQQQ